MSRVSGSRSKTEVIKRARTWLSDYLLLRRLCKWVPALIRLHDCIVPLCETPVELDPLRSELVLAGERISGNLDVQQLGTVSGLVAGECV